MKRRLPIVTEATFDKIDIATPCHADWSQMAGDDRVRHCGDCRLNVYNVAAMTRAEAATLIATNEGGRTCLRLYRRPDGTLLTQDCWARLRAARQRGWLAFAAALVIVGLTQLGLRFSALGWLIKQQQRKPPVVSIEPPGIPMMGAPRPVVVPPPDDERHYLKGEMAAPAPVTKPPKPDHVKMGKMIAPRSKD